MRGGCSEEGREGEGGGEETARSWPVPIFGFFFGLLLKSVRRSQ